MSERGLPGEVAGFLRELATYEPGTPLTERTSELARKFLTAYGGPRFRVDRPVVIDADTDHSVAGVVYRQGRDLDRNWCYDVRIGDSGTALGQSTALIVERVAETRLQYQDTVIARLTAAAARANG